ncbi:MAG: hypothetical protein AB1555_06190 [Nitrospirota bacterium]
MMKRVLLGFFVVFTVYGAAMAGAEAYRLVMSKDKELCQTVLTLFNADMKRYKEIRYDDDIFRAISWKSVDLGEQTYGCYFLSHAMFDINNDGREDLVIKQRSCLRDILVDKLFVFPQDSDVLSRIHAGPGGGEALDQTKNRFFEINAGHSLEGLSFAESQGLPQGIGGTVLHPFLWKNKAYVSMTDFDPEWIVIARYLEQQKFQDVCYFRGRKIF